MIVVAGLILAFVLIVIFSNRATRGCRWREDRSADHDGKRMYRCAACGAVAFTSTGKPPLVCHRNKPVE
ncbi:MAG: hypothetical protein RIG84_20650 [Roseovarius sp.]